MLSVGQSSRIRRWVESVLLIGTIGLGWAGWYARDGGDCHTFSLAIAGLAEWKKTPALVLSGGRTASNKRWLSVVLIDVLCEVKKREQRLWGRAERREDSQVESWVESDNRPFSTVVFIVVVKVMDRHPLEHYPRIRPPPSSFTLHRHISPSLQYFSRFYQSIFLVFLYYRIFRNIEPSKHTPRIFLYGISSICLVDASLQIFRLNKSTYPKADSLYGY